MENRMKKMKTLMITLLLSGCATGFAMEDDNGGFVPGAPNGFDSASAEGGLMSLEDFANLTTKEQNKYLKELDAKDGAFTKAATPLEAMEIYGYLQTLVPAAKKSNIHGILNRWNSALEAGNLSAQKVARHKTRVTKVAPTFGTFSPKTVLKQINTLGYTTVGEFVEAFDDHRLGDEYSNQQRDVVGGRMSEIFKNAQGEQGSLDTATVEQCNKMMTFLEERLADAQKYNKTKLEVLKVLNIAQEPVRSAENEDEEQEGGAESEDAIADYMMRLTGMIEDCKKRKLVLEQEEAGSEDHNEDNNENHDQQEGTDDENDEDMFDDE